MAPGRHQQQFAERTGYRAGHDRLAAGGDAQLHGCSVARTANCLCWPGTTGTTIRHKRTRPAPDRPRWKWSPANGAVYGNLGGSPIQSEPSGVLSTLACGGEADEGGPLRDCPQVAASRLGDGEEAGAISRACVRAAGATDRLTEARRQVSRQPSQDRPQAQRWCAKRHRCWPRGRLPGS